MTTQLRRYRDAYASLVVAVYEPLIIGWVSETAVDYAAGVLSTWSATKTASTRSASSIAEGGDGDDSTAVANLWSVDTSGRVVSPTTLGAEPVEGVPGAVRIGNALYPAGVVSLARAGGDRPDLEAADGELDLKTVSVTSGPGLAQTKPLPDFEGTKTGLAKGLMKTLGQLDTLPASEARKQVLETKQQYLGPDAADVFKVDITAELAAVLSPLGIAHFYRQLYFNLDEGVGPIEEAFTIAPLETLEVVYETTRRQIHEEVLETGLETTAEAEVESHNLEEISDKVSSMIQRDMTAAMSASASYTTPTFQIGVSASGNLSESTQRGREEASRRLKEVTKRASERITKTFTLRTRTVDELSTAARTRRLIKNDAEHPVSYGLRRVLRRVLVKVQDLGPRLVWQVYLRDPGKGLAKSRFVHFAGAQPISVPDLPPGVPARPQGGTETGSATCAVKFTGTTTTATSPDQPLEPSLFTGQAFVTLEIAAPADRDVVAVVVDSMSDVGDPNPKNDRGEPAPLKYGQVTFDAATNKTSIKIDIRAGDSMSVAVNYTYTWKPSAQALAEWEKQRKAVVDQLSAQAGREEFQKAFEREKALITERSKIRPRPAADLRREERYELMERLVARLFAAPSSPADPTPLEIESFHRLFDVEGIFSYTHPAWWKPRYTRDGPVMSLPEYEITSESEPVPMGRSLGWALQLDGDARRNEFLNSPWARVCVPIRPGREREAARWLAQFVEGDVGFDISSAGSPFKKLLDAIATVRKNESGLGVKGPDYVEVGTAVPTGSPGPLSPQTVYPVIDEFEATVPTDGFVYDELTIQA
jgi:hypothetical protein